MDSKPQRNQGARIERAVIRRILCQAETNVQTLEAAAIIRWIGGEVDKHVARVQKRKGGLGRK